MDARELKKYFFRNTLCLKLILWELEIITRKFAHKNNENFDSKKFSDYNSTVNNNNNNNNNNNEPLAFIIIELSQTEYLLNRRNLFICFEFRIFCA